MTDVWQQIADLERRIEDLQRATRWARYDWADDRQFSERIREEPEYARAVVDSACHAQAEGRDLGPLMVRRFREARRLLLGVPVPPAPRRLVPRARARRVRVRTRSSAVQARAPDEPPPGSPTVNVPWRGDS